MSYEGLNWWGSGELHFSISVDVEKLPLASVDPSQPM